MTPRKRKTTTDATKPKLPLPKGHPQRKAPTKRKPPLRASKKVKAEGAEWDAVGTRKVNPYILATPSPIAGQSIDGIGSAPLDVPRAIPCGEDTDANGVFRPKPNVTYDLGTFEIPKRFEREVVWRVAASLPPDTSSYPWPLRFAWWLDGWLTKTAQRFA